MNLEQTLSLPIPAPIPRPRHVQTVLNLLEKIEGGSLAMVLPGGARLAFGHGAPMAEISVRDLAMFEAVLARGDIGFAESYLEGLWDTPDLATLLTLLNANRAVITRALYGRPWALLGARLKHLINANTRAGSKRNILAHYDLGNAFYALWLDRGMSYSAATFEGDPEASLETAQLAKNRRLLAGLAARPGQRVLEIGCGWGGFAELAAREGELAVHGITLSPAQLGYARARVARAGLAHRVDFELRDYRDLEGRYDHIVSVEMFEAVGERWWPAWFRSVARQLAPGGRAMVQTITIDEALFARYRRGSDFIQQYVFPGGMLPTVEAFTREASRAGLEVRERFGFGPDYARTLARWSANFEAAWPQISALGFDERFRRLWRFYLAYCQAGFATGSTNVFQFQLAHAS